MSKTPSSDFLEKKEGSATTFRIPHELRKEFKIYCAKQDRSMQYVLLQLIKNAVSRDKYKQPKRVDGIETFTLPEPSLETHVKQKVSEKDRPPEYKEVAKEPKGITLVKREPEPTEEPEPKVIKPKKSTVKIR